MREVETGLGEPDGGQPPSCDVSDACDQLGVAAVRTGSLRPLWPACPGVAGRLTTVRLEPSEGAPSPLAELLEWLSHAGDRVVLVDLGGRTDRQCWGSVLATAALAYGIRGALVNGAARDIDGLRDLGFPTYARGVYPGAIRGRLRFSAADDRVGLDGGVVEPGDLAVVDSSGAVFVPAARVDEVVALACRREAREREQRRAVEKGADPLAVFLGDGGTQVAPALPPQPT